MRRPSEPSAVAEPFQVPSSGSLSFGESRLTFNEWQVQYRAIQSAILQTHYALGFPRHILLITDGTNNYLFHIPNKEAGAAFPFKVVYEGKQSLWRRFWWIIIPVSIIAMQVYK